MKREPQRPASPGSNPKPLPPARPPLAPAEDAPPSPGSGSRENPIPILIPVSPGRPGQWYPTRPGPAASRPSRVAQRPAPAPAAPARPKSELRITLHLEQPPAPVPPPGRPMPPHDEETKLIPRLGVEERRRMLVDLFEDVAGRIEMLDDNVPL